MVGEKRKSYKNGNCLRQVYSNKLSKKQKNKSSFVALGGPPHPALFYNIPKKKKKNQKIISLKPSMYEAYILLAYAICLDEITNPIPSGV